MAGDVHVVFDETALRVWADHAAGLERVKAEVAQKLVIAMKRRCPVSPPGPLHRSGRLRSSIMATRQPDGSYHIGPHEDYAGYVNEGTPAHLIVSRGPWPLRNRETGQVFGRVVHHPGTMPTHFIERAADDVPHAEYRV